MAERTVSDLQVAATVPLTAVDDGGGDRAGSDLAMGKFTLVRRLGEGGMAEVYLGRNNTIGKQVAIKVLDPRYAVDPVHVERFVQEARATSAIAHDNVIDVTDFGTTPDGSAFIVMELLEGEPLSQTLEREGPFSWRRTKQVILQICRALHAAHACGVYHRDVKPDNCYRMARGANRDFIKVLDFGLAKVVGDELKPMQSLTQTGHVFGTPDYMSPEQARGQRSDHRSDVYAVGVMLYEMATGSRPFEAKTTLALLTKQANDTPQPPTARAPAAGISRELETIILRALEKKADDRFQSMREMAEAIAALPVDAGSRFSGPQPAPTSATPTPYRGLAIVLGVLSVLLGIALAFSLTR